MNTALLLSAWLVPLALLPLAFSDAGRWWTAAAALPALAAALWVPAGASLDISWLLLGARLGLDAHGPLFLGFAAVLWSMAGLHAALHMRGDAHARRFRLFYLLAMAGNFGLIVGQDLVSFYFGFALMGLAAYGLVVHEGTARVRHAGRVYLVMTLVGEVALFLAFLLLYRRTGSLAPEGAQLVGGGALELGLLTLAFGIKAGLIGLHVWLPLAHPAAPVAASAVLSGAMIKAALIGWSRYLPLGEQALPELGTVLALAGFAGAILAIPLGLVQRDPKVVLAYSSVGKMGTLTAGLGIAALAPSAAPALMAALVFYAAHHGFAKGALFLGVGVVKSSTARWPLLLLALPALVLAGAPFTSGAQAKNLLSGAMTGAPSDWIAVASWVMLLTTAGTTLLMARFLYLTKSVSGGAAGDASLAVPWLILIGASLAFPLLHQDAQFSIIGAWPILAAVLIAWLVARAAPPALSRWVGRIAPGDVLDWLLRVWDSASRVSRPRFIHLANLLGHMSLKLTRANRWAIRTTQAGEAVLLKSMSASFWLFLSALLIMLVVSFP